MKIYVNGQQKSFENKEISLTSLIEKLALNEKKIVKSKKTKPQLNQAQIDASKSKIESEVKTHSKVIKKNKPQQFS